jgi:hypothetical protein
MKICVINDNFEDSIAALNSKSFFNEDIIYRFLYDGLKPKYKKYLLENDLPKNRIFIYITYDKKNELIIKKYKHQIKFLKSEKHDIFETFNNIFRGIKTPAQLLIELSYFENRHILTILESSAVNSYTLAKKMSDIDKYVYTSFFKYLVVYNLYKCNAVAVWVKHDR